MAAPPGNEPLDLARAYEEHADHVWRLLQRMGVPARHAPDLVQEVFLVLCRRQEALKGGPVKGLLWQITRGLAANHRRAKDQSHVVLGHAPERADQRDPESMLRVRRRAARAREAIESLDEEKRAVFVMFEAEAMGCKAIAEELGLPLGTVHSRLHAARRILLAALADEATPQAEGAGRGRVESP